MTGKSKTECCNGDCNQDRDCPIYKEIRRHNALNWSNNKFEFTWMEIIVLIICGGVIILLMAK